MVCNRVDIIGASSAGLYTALVLARKGIPVRVFDASSDLAPEARTLILTPEFSRLFPSSAEEVILNRIHQISLFSRSSHVCVALGEPDIVVDRKMMIQCLASDARHAGVELLLGYQLLGLEKVESELVMKFYRTALGDTIAEKTRVLIAADGVRSGVARALGMNVDTTIANVQAQIQLPADIRPDTACVWFARQDTPYFYWLIPECSKTAVVGVAADKMPQAEELLNRFLSDRGWHPLSIQASYVAGHNMRYSSSTSMGDAAIFTVGDAAGHVKVTTIGGVVAGFCGAEAVVRAIMRREDGHSMRHPIRWELSLHNLMRAFLNRLSDSDYDKLLGLLNGKTLDLLRRYNRDELRRSFWKFPLAQPRWILFAARIIARSLIDRKSWDGVLRKRTSRLSVTPDSVNRGNSAPAAFTMKIGKSD
jgi:flavin-dependent dehydrogenase